MKITARMLAAASVALGPTVPAMEQDAKPEPQAQSAPSISDLSDLSIEETTATRCGIAFAIGQGMQQSGDERSSDWPDIQEAGGREFFVRAVVGLMDAHSLDRQTVLDLADKEVARHMESGLEEVTEMMPGCLLLLEAADLSEPEG